MFFQHLYNKEVFIKHSVMLFVAHFVLLGLLPYQMEGRQEFPVATNNDEKILVQTSDRYELPRIGAGKVFEDDVKKIYEDAAEIFEKKIREVMGQQKRVKNYKDSTKGSKTIRKLKTHWRGKKILIKKALIGREKR